MSKQTADVRRATDVSVNARTAREIEEELEHIRSTDVSVNARTARQIEEEIEEHAQFLDAIRRRNEFQAEEASRREQARADASRSSKEFWREQAVRQASPEPDVDELHAILAEASRTRDGVEDVIAQYWVRLTSIAAMMNAEWARLPSDQGIDLYHNLYTREVRLVMPLGPILDATALPGLETFLQAQRVLKSATALENRVQTALGIGLESDMTAQWNPFADAAW